MKLQRPKGTVDILPGESEKWQFVEATMRRVFATYRFSEIRTPLFEHYEVISRSVGDTTDIVTKEMYDFYDKGDRHVTLRPEGTAPVVRSYVENKKFAPEVQKPFKVYYTGSMFRYERPQAGRLREFHQIGVENFGSKNPATDVETIAMAKAFFDQVGVKNIKLVINSLGDSETRERYREALIGYLEQHLDSLSDDSKRRLHENPLRVLDSKDKQDIAIVKDAPSILDFLTDASQQHLTDVKAMLESLNIAYTVDQNMVRGLDYYNDTIFEFMTEIKGKELTICGGGRYDSLVSYFGGPETPGFGFGIGVDRLLLVLEEQGASLPAAQPLDVYVVVLGASANVAALKLVQSLRDQGYAVERDVLNRKIKQQFKSAEEFGAKVIITLGESEVETGEIVVKNNATRAEVKTTLSEIQSQFDTVFTEVAADA
ncbi:MAG: histidine--tRNA ligase [Lactococcus raffinolactis]|jgi:histidyl-tRNA synthetase|uniref:histidine--tRNA ligase n=1 Tax=Pseudolactococcus raffinolactis TaxID=1366 RepID=UPI0011091A1C|nr:histidine--tRNA ligase [Lactococcus raffinolactis]MBW9297479.1 histidine--tRNA ligase [Lactococcus raffinolactis]MBW9330418.1 histidine--tRNA ligase [Lactococcus raffinolactis]MCH4161496.1 histidine--tRNA ligase [Lactococcus raffinolactis]MDT2765860.1 histidine--tRNA ligase [Lactococcus raffinolactis]MDT2789090.1 histidine--tRNA ligase [Lactococcus raffinolactis]